MISIVIPIHNASSSLRRCLESVVASPHSSSYECIVVNDCSTDDSGTIARTFPVRVVDLEGGPFGPAYARNRGAEAARGDLLFFVDGDVVLQLTTLDHVRAAFTEHPEIAAVFGSYDDHPEALDFLSRYRNLLHHFIHQQGCPEARTFWSACGAIRRSVFLELGGFDEVRYPHPSIEDIDLGYRLHVRGHRILLDKQMQVQHLKRWTLRGMIKTDVFDRAIPWTRLILRARGLPNDLNLRRSHRLSAILLAIMVLYVGAVGSVHSLMTIPAFGGLFLLAAGNWSEGKPHFQMSRRALKLTYTLLATAAVVNLYFGMAQALAPVAVCLAGILVDRWPSQARQLWDRVLFSAMVLALAAGMVMALSSFPLKLVAPLALIPAAIMLLNYRLYEFFMRKQGAIFALAAVPFHILYYLYSSAGFVLGVGSYIWQSFREQRGGVA